MKQLLDARKALLRETTPVEELRKIFVRRLNDNLFIYYGNMIAPDAGYVEKIWAGYEYLTDSLYFDI